MKTLKYILCAMVLVLGIASCEQPDNINPKAATEVPIGTLFTNATVNLVNTVNSMSVNTNINRLIMQYWQECTYFTESRYNFQDRKIPDNYARSFYKDVMMDLKEAKTLLAEKEYTGTLAIERDNQVAMCDILQVYAMQCVVDAFGDMPYSEALLGIEDPTPVYDGAASIYADLLTRIAADIAALDASQGGFGSADLLYQGSTAKWKAFAASLQLRLGMRLADVNSSAASAAASAAIAAGVIGSEDESTILYYSGVSPHVNTIYSGFTISGRKDYIPTLTIVDMMVGMDDPRVELYFTAYPEAGTYTGAIPGLDGAQSFNNYSHFADRFMQAGFEAILFDYSETLFLMAEAAERGFISGDAEALYGDAVTASIEYWGGTAADAATYVAANAYDNSTWESLATQKYIALYNRGTEAWAEWRRLDFPILNVPEGMVYGDIPSRWPYPYDEIKNNKANYTAAAAAIGGDDHRTKLFWDVN